MVGVPTTGVARAGEMTLAGVFPPEGTPIGKISVLSSRFFFGFGSGAVQETRLANRKPTQQTSIILTLIILLHIKPPQQHNRLLTEQASIDRERRVNAFVHVNSHDAAGAAEAVIEAAEVDGADSELAQSRSAHDAGLDGHVEVGGVQDGRVVAGHDFAEGDELGVAGALVAVLLVIL